PCFTLESCWRAFNGNNTEIIPEGCWPADANRARTPHHVSGGRAQAHGCDLWLAFAAVQTLGGCSSLRARQDWELAKVVIVFNGEPFDALALERIGEPEYAVRRASGAVEYSPHSRAPDPQPLRLVQRPRYLKSG